MPARRMSTGDVWYGTWWDSMQARLGDERLQLRFLGDAQQRRDLGVEVELQGNGRSDRERQHAPAVAVPRGSSHLSARF